MPVLNVTIPGTLAATLTGAVARARSSPDSVVTAALSRYFRSDRHRAYQISTSAALVEGVLQGAVSARTLLANGDFGLGTFEHLDGEMVVLDGAIYQVRGDGTVQRRQDDFEVPFAIVSRFQPDDSFELRSAQSLEGLSKACDGHRESANLFYALRVDGVFDSMFTRAVRASTGGAKLVAAAQAQAEFHFQNVAGTLVCIWSPSYSSSFSIPGYHFHFISDDRRKGGHVLDCSGKALRIGIQTLFEYDVKLPEAGPFESADLAVDTTGDLKKAE